MESDYDPLIGVEAAQCTALYPASCWDQPKTGSAKFNRLLELLVPACAGALLSVPWSAKLVRRLPESLLRRCIAVLTCGLGLFILIRALG